MTPYTARRGFVRRGVSARAVAAAVALVASALGASSPAIAQTQPFTDTAEDAYYSDAVNALAGGGVFDGTECAEGMLCPGGAIDRKTMAVWTVRALDSGDPAQIPNSRFSDVAADSFHGPFIERMAQLGVTAGCGDGTFCPDKHRHPRPDGRVPHPGVRPRPRPGPRLQRRGPRRLVLQPGRRARRVRNHRRMRRGHLLPHTTNHPRPNGHLPRPSHRPPRSTHPHPTQHLQDRHRRRGALVCDSDRQHHHLLGKQRLRGG